MPTFDENVHQKICRAFDGAGIFDSFITLCQRFAVEQPGTGPRLTAAELGKALARHIAPVKTISRFQTVQAGMETIADWTWFGAVVVQHGATLEVMFEGKTDKASAGSTLYDMRNTALRLRSAPGSGPPYLRPAYDGNTQRLDRLAAELATLIQTMKDTVRRTALDWAPTS